MLTDAVSKVEMLNAVQQLTATITPPSMVNMMSNDEDRCFQWQEHGYIAWNCPYIRRFECDEYGHIIMDCSTQDTSSQEPQQNITNPNHTNTIIPGLAPDTAMRTGKGQVIPGNSHVSTNICSSSHHDSYRGHSRSHYIQDNHHHPRSSSWTLQFHLQPSILMQYTRSTTLQIIHT